MTRRTKLMHIILNGGTGYIGRRVLQIALRQGHRATLLGADHAMGEARAVSWRLGEAVPEAAWSQPADAVIHLAHLWHPQGPQRAKRPADAKKNTLGASGRLPPSGR